MNRRVEPGQPKKKKQRVEEGVADREEEPRRERQSHKMQTAKKRKGPVGEERKAKKARTNNNIKNIFLVKDGEKRKHQ